MSRRHHHHIVQPYDYERFNERDRDREGREQARAIEYQDDSLSSINSDEDSYLHHQHTNKDKKSNFYTTKNDSNKPNKVEKSTDSYHQDMKKQPQYTTSNSDATLERLTRLESMIEQLVKRSDPPSETSVSASAPEKSSNERRGQFSLEPRRHTFTTSMWINKIQEISIQNNWDEKTTISYMGSQMSGIIKAWYNNLPNYDYTWPEWKILITKMFPDNTDFVTSLKRLVTRLKQADENMVTYYFSKMYLIEACKITGEDAVSCLIDGLNNQSIQEQAKSQNFLTPETLYSQFLTTLPEYTVDYSPSTPTDTVLNTWYYPEEENVEEEEEEEEEMVPQEQVFEFGKDPRSGDFDYRTQGNPNFRENNVSKRSTKSPPKRTASVHSRLDKRFIRPPFKHQNKVPMAAKVCSICFNRGHLARNCRNAEKMMYCRLGNKTPARLFFKNCTINGQKLESFVDTGCTTVTIKEQVARALGLEITSTEDYLEVYGGGSIAVLGETKIALEVDSVAAYVRAMVVADQVQEVDVVIGQQFLNQKNVSMIVHRETLNFLRHPLN